jgi:uncharacterized membrane protein YebE (DUF533 family)
MSALGEVRSGQALFLKGIVMFNPQEILGALMEAGTTGSGASRIRNAMGPSAAQGGDLFGELFGGNAGGGDLLGNLAAMAQQTLGGAGQQLREGNPLAIGGLAALAGAVLGGGGGAMKGAVGGGTLALLGGLAYKVLQGARASQGAPAARPEELPLGLREPADAGERRVLDDRAQLVMLAMVNAMKADGRIDRDEMQRLEARLEASGAGAEARQSVMELLRRPPDLDGLVTRVPDRETGVQVYAASLLAIEADTEAERRYLRDLADRLGLDQRVTAAVRGTLGVSEFA